jgi:hypothetical protein
MDHLGIGEVVVASLVVATTFGLVWRCADLGGPPKWQWLLRAGIALLIFGPLVFFAYLTIQKVPKRASLLLSGWTSLNGTIIEVCILPKGGGRENC